MFKDKVVIITGATGGIGSEITRKFAEDGAKITIVGTNQEKLNKLVGKLNIPEDRFLTVVANVTKEEDVQNYVDLTIKKFNKIDIFINNAGFEGSGTQITDTTAEDFNKVIDINVNGVFFGMKHVLKHMQSQKSGVIVNTASVAGLIGSPGMAAYCASKHAVLGLTKSAALENAKLGIRVNAVCPGPVDTRMMRSLEDLLIGGPEEEAKKVFESGVPMGRYAKPSEVADLMVFLASDNSRYITGAAYRIDGGSGAQ